MRVTRATALAVAVLAFGSFSGMAQAAQPGSASTATRYASCKALNKVYKGGVSRKAGLPNRHAYDTDLPLSERRIVRSSYRPKVSATLYRANAGLDRDKDGIACER